MKRVVYLLLVISVVISCSRSEGNENHKTISVSIQPFKFFTERIAGDRYEVKVIVPPGASPATYEPTPSVIRALGGSEIVVLNGYLGFEIAWMDKIMQVNSSAKKLLLADSQDLVRYIGHRHIGSEEHSGVDPHFWISPLSARRIAASLLDFLAEYDPANQNYYKTNYQSLMREIDSTHYIIETILQPLDRRAFMIFHPALTYFARDYNLEQIPVEIEGKEPSLSDMKDFIDRARSENIKVIMVQKEFDKKNVQIIADEIGAVVVEIDPLSGNWIDAVIFIANAVAAG
ncbi:MAG: zinc ABC transporter substrate-binding protein, partial [Bacteroidales bacterium]|nr:zinc ABC transporter substrate-binding protein [Bacteroidales bacterium]